MKKWLGKPLREEMVPKRELDAVAQKLAEMDKEYRLLEARYADLTDKYTALGFDEALRRGIAREAIALLQTVNTGRTGGVALQIKIDDIVARAGHLGLVQEKQEKSV